MPRNKRNTELGTRNSEHGTRNTGPRPRGGSGIRVPGYGIGAGAVLRAAAADAHAKDKLEALNLSAVAGIEMLAAAEGETPKRPTFTITAYNGGLLRVAAFYRPVVIDLAGLRAGRVTVLRDHDPGRIIGQGVASIDKSKIVVGGQITGDPADKNDPAYQVVTHAKNGFIWSASVGVDIERTEYVDAGAKVTVNGHSFAGPIAVVRAGRLGEVSFVGFGADEKASAKVAAQAANTNTGMGENEMKFEQWLEAMGLVAADLTEEQKSKLQAKYDAEEHGATGAGKPVPRANQPAPGAGGPTGRDVDSVIAAAKAERERCRQISAIIEEAASIRGADLDALDRLSASAVDEHMPVKDLELAVLRMTRPKVPAVHAGNAVAAPEALEAAALMSVGFGGDTLAKSHGEQTVEAAERRFGRTIGLQELILAAAQVNGYTGRSRVTTGNWREIIGWATRSRPDIQAAGGFSTVDLTGILGNVANKALAAVAGEPQWVAPLIAGVASHANFHSHTVYSLAMTGELLPVGPTGELKHMAFGEESYTRQVGTRGAILKLSRTDIINDDLGVFTRNASGLARKAYNTREKALMTVVCATAAGASHFTAARGNYLTGAGTAFGAAAMGNGIKAFRNLKGPDNDPIMVEPALVLVPSTLEDEARRLLAAGGTVVMYGIGNAKSIGSSPNIYAGRFGAVPQVSPWLENSALTGYSAAYWYLLADPAIYPCFEIAYLNGNQSPIVEYFGLESEADTLGMTWRVYWDFGVGAAEWRAGVKSAGA